MKKITALLTFILCFSIICHSQNISISPQENAVVCPGVDYEFYVAITNASEIASVDPISSPVAPILVDGPYQIIKDNGNISFKFKVRFIDENRNQTIYIVYRPLGSLQLVNHTFYFSGVKSFRYLNPGSIPQVNTFVLKRCQGQTYTSNSNPVYFYNQTNPSNPVYLANENTFEYQLPNGWGIGSSTSNGTDWITSQNIASITTTASGGQIKVRAVNSCGLDLLKGPETMVSISRPAPELTVVGDSFLCSGSKSFLVGGDVPPGASFCWSSSNTNIATLSSTCGLPASLNFVNNGFVRLSATATDCEGSYSVTYPKDVLIGVSVGGYYSITSNYHSSGNQLTLYNNNTTIFLPSNQGFGINAYLTSPGRTGNAIWSRNTSSYPFFWYQIGSSTLTFSGNSASTAYQQRTGIFNVSAPTACGTFSGQFSWPIVTQGWSFRVASSPNPSTNALNISLVDGEENSGQKLVLPVSSIISIEISRFDNAKQVKSWTLKGSSADLTLDVSELPNATYVLRVTIDGTSKTSQIIIRR